MGDMADDCRRKEEEYEFNKDAEEFKKEVKMEDNQIIGTIDRSTGIREHNGKNQIGFTLKENPEKWCNLQGDDEELNKLLKLVKKGNEVMFNLDALSNVAKNFTCTKQAESGKWDDEIVNFETLLTAAHKKKVEFSIKTECITVDLEKKYALFKATVEIVEEGIVKEYQAHGDATDNNVKGDFIKPHFIRMAETRAICRALRWYTNNGCAEEEKGK